VTATVTTHPKIHMVALTVGVTEIKFVVVPGDVSSTVLNLRQAANKLEEAAKK
jgi:hypothetical protein